MATLTQPVLNSATTFTPINNSLEDTTIINSPAGASVSKVKQTTISAKLSSNMETNTQLVNGISSPTPQTTSQNKPPKIKLLNRSSNVGSPVTMINRVEDVEELTNEDSGSDSGRTIEITSSESISEPSPTDNVIVDMEKQVDASSCKNNSTPPRNADSVPRHITSHSSTEYSSSPSSTTSSLNRENSLDYKDSTGVNLHDFMVKTLKENPRDRLMLLKLEKDFKEFITDNEKTCYKYEQMTSYHRMLVHRVAAYFGLDHNVDSTGKAVVISKTPSSRAPETRFQSYCSREYTDEEIAAAPKAILIRCSSADEQALPSNFHSEDRQFSLEDKKLKSFEEREEDYIKAKDRIFKEEGVDLADQSSSAVYSPNNRGSDGSSPSMSEREAAIATVAARTGGKAGSNLKRGDRKNTVDLQLPNQTSYWLNENHRSNPNEYYSYQTAGNSYPGTHVVRGQPINAGDGTQMYYPAGYQSSTQLAYVPNVANGGYIQQAQQSSPYMPFYYVSSGAPGVAPQAVSGAVNPQQPQVQQYYVHQAPSGQIFYTPKQTTNDPQILNPPHQQAHVQQQQQQQVLQYQQEFANQINNLTIDEHAAGRQSQQQQQQQQLHKSRNEAEKQTQQHSQVTSPTSPAEPSPAQTPGTEYPQNHRKQQTVYLPGGQMAHVAQQYNVAGYPMQIYHNANTTFASYQDNAHYTSNTSQPSTPTSVHPPPSPNTVLLQAYPTPRNPAQSPIAQPSPQQLQQSHAAIAHINSPRQRFVSPNVYPYQRDGRVYVPLAAAGNPNQMTMALVRAPHSEVKIGGVAYDMAQMYRANKVNMNSVTTPVVTDSSAAAEYGKPDPQTYALQQQQLQQQQRQQQQQLSQHQQNLIALQQQQRPLMQFQPHYQQAYYMSQNKRYIPRQMGPNHFIRANTMRKYRPPRHVTGNQQIRISRPNSMSLDPDQNTVSHILEVYDFPDTVVSDSDGIFEDVRGSGARILKINSSSQSGHAAVQRPTILAIFKSAAEAQSALESVKSPYYKLRVSKKSPTHLSSSDYHPNSASHGKTS